MQEMYVSEGAGVCEVVWLCGIGLGRSIVTVQGELEIIMTTDLLKDLGSRQRRDKEQGSVVSVVVAAYVIPLASKYFTL